MTLTLCCVSGEFRYVFDDASLDEVEKLVTALSPFEIPSIPIAMVVPLLGQEIFKVGAPLIKLLSCQRLSRKTVFIRVLSRVTKVNNICEERSQTT
jgi:hypothetical protein